MKTKATTSKQQAIQDMRNDVPRNLLSYENMIVESLRDEDLNMGTTLWY